MSILQNPLPNPNEAPPAFNGNPVKSREFAITRLSPGLLLQAFSAALDSDYSV
jgi:hypothetical protein